MVSAAEYKDFVFVYTGSDTRPVWNETAFRELLTCDGRQLSKREFFRSVVLLETRSNARKAFAHPSSKRPAAGGADDRDWLNLIDTWFSRDGALESLNRAASSLNSGVVDVWIGIPEPIKGTAFFIPGKGPTNLVSDADRVRAVQWFVETVFERWQTKNFQRLRFVGFYWLDESLVNTKDIVVQAISVARSTAVRKGFSPAPSFLWVPFWKAKYRADWKMLGFDVAVIQPNLYVKDDVAESRVLEALDFASTSGMGFEIEIDDKIFSDPLKRIKAGKYLSSLQKGSPFGSVVGLYQGNGAILKINKDVSTQDYAKDLCDVISDRAKLHHR